MAMKPCLECGKEVSTDAKVCPNCGRVRPTKKKISVLGWVGIVLVVLFIVGSIASPSEKPAGAPVTAPVAASPSAAPAPPATPAIGGNWTVSEDVSSIDDSKTVTLHLVANSPISGWPSQTETPSLIIRCKEKSTDLFINNGMSPDVEYGLDGASVTLRIDSEKAFTREWSKSTDGDALFAPSPIALAKRLAKASTLIYRFTPFNSNPAETSFTLTGLADVMPKVAAACKWPA